MLNFDSRWFRDKLIDSRKSQRQMADALGIDKATAHNIVNGKRPIKLEEVGAIAAFFHVTANEVLTHAGVSGIKRGACLENEDKRIAEVDVRGLDLSNDDIINADESGWSSSAPYFAVCVEYDPSTARVIVIQGDSMEPTLRSGDRVLIDSTDVVPSPPGVFSVWDGVGISIKRLSVSLRDRMIVEVNCDNPLLPNHTIELAELRILGRVVWAARKM